MWSSTTKKSSKYYEKEQLAQCLDLGGSVRREYFKRTQLIDRWMEQNLGVQDSRSAGGNAAIQDRQAIYQRRLGLGTGYQERRKRERFSIPPGTLDH
jgi:hypothetical protein